MSKTLEELRSRPHVSASSLTDFMSCSLRYAFRRIEGMQVEAEFTPSALVLGGQLHKAGAYVYRKRMDGVKPNAAEASELFAELWFRAVKATPDIKYKSGDDANSLCELGMNMIACLVENQDPADRIIAVDLPFSIALVDASGATVPNIDLIGEMDAVIKRGETTCVWDLKSAARSWGKDKADEELQATAYTMAYKHLYKEDALMAYEVITKSAKNPKHEIIYTSRSNDDFLRFVELVKMMQSMIAAGHVMPQRGMFCNQCPFQTACRSWHRKRETLISNAA